MQNKSSFSRLWTVITMVALLGSLLAAPAAPVAAPSTSLRAMPPHPDLLDDIQSGKVQLPEFLINPQLAAEQGLNARGLAPQALTGTIKALAVVVDFSDNVHTVQASYFDSLIFAAPVAGRGSVRDYFNEISYGQIDIITLNAPAAWVRAPGSYASYVNSNNCVGTYPNNCQKLAEDIAAAIDGAVNFANYDNNNDGYVDNLMIVHAGPGAEFTGYSTDIWSHSWNTSYPQLRDGKYVFAYTIMPEFMASVTATTSDMTIGVFAHEMGHGFWNLPDLYDTDNSSEGIGNWSLMASGSWNGTYPGGNSPAWPDAWSRIRMGIASATPLTGTYINKSIPQAYNNPGAGQTIFKLKSTSLGTNEYWLVENRQQTSGTYDQYLPNGGLLIWHIDESKMDNDSECRVQPSCSCGGSQYLVSLEQADGLKNLEFPDNTSSGNRGDTGDSYPGSSNNRNFNATSSPKSSSFYTCTDTQVTITNISNSAATMTADIEVGPKLSIGNAVLFEGNAGSIPMTFTVKLSNGDSLSTVTVNYATANNSATAPADFTSTSGTLTFTPGQTSKTITVQIVGDTALEGTETFYVNLSAPVNATLADAQALGIILDNESTYYFVHLPAVLR